MPRSVKTDYMQNFRFMAVAFDAENKKRMQYIPPAAGNQIEPEAGFSSCGTPSATVEVAEYREGTSVYTKKFPGVPSVEDITMQRGVARGDSTFWAWTKQVIEGSGEYRCTVEINHYARDLAYGFSGGVTTDQVLTTPLSTPQNALANLTSIKSDSPPGRIYRLFEAWPNAHKSSADFEATSSDIAVKDLTVVFEYFEILEDIS